MALTENVVRGQRVYNTMTLAIYDIALFKILTKYVWHCPTAQLQQLYDQNVSNNHLDVGVGSGYLLDHSQLFNRPSRLCLMDLNEDCLRHTCKRLKRYNPICYKHNILSPFEDDIEKFDSISLNYVLHCLPGTIENKCSVFKHLYDLLNPGGILFGFTILAENDNTPWLSKRVLSIYNKKGVFSNLQDTESNFDDQLRANFKNYRIDTIGHAMRFLIRKPE